MLFAAKALLMATAQTGDNLAAALTESVSAADVAQDLEKLKPNVVLETLKGCVPGLIGFGYRLIIALLILFVGFRVVKLIRGILEHTFAKMGLNMNVSKLLTNLIDALFYALIIFMAAERIGVPSASIVALLGSAGIAIGLSLQGSLSNVAGGLLILLTHPFTMGDYISGAGVEGTVQNIGIAYTTLLTIDNKKITIPNSSISNSTITNMSAEEKRRVDIEVGISYKSDIQKAKQVMEQVYLSCSEVLAADGITVYVSKLGESAIMLGGRGWVKSADYWTALWYVQEHVKLEFDKAGVEIPYNQVDVNIRTMPKA